MLRLLARPLAEAQASIFTLKSPHLRSPSRSSINVLETVAPVLVSEGSRAANGKPPPPAPRAPPPPPKAPAKVVNQRILSPPRSPPTRVRHLHHHHDPHHHHGQHRHVPHHLLLRRNDARRSNSLQQQQQRGKTAPLPAHHGALQSPPSPPLPGLSTAGGLPLIESRYSKRRHHVHRYHGLLPQPHHRQPPRRRQAHRLNRREVAITD